MNVYEVMTAEIIKKLEEGKIPWTKSYQGIQRPPTNFKSKKIYRGINFLMLSMSGRVSPYWLTYKQSKELNGQVIKGEKGIKILFAKMIKKRNANGDEEDKAIYRYSTVFNVEQIDGIECPFKDDTGIEAREVNYIDECERAIDELTTSKRIPTIIHHDLQISSYSPSKDLIYSCKQKNFISDEEYYSTLFHEITHSTGHKSRCDRDMTSGSSKKSKAYAKEELIAELGAYFICGMTGIKTTATINNSAAYIQHYLQLFNNDPKLVVSASSQAQKAMDYLKL